MTREEEIAIINTVFSNLWDATKDSFIAEIAKSCRVSTEQHLGTQFTKPVVWGLVYRQTTSCIYLVLKVRLSSSISKTTSIDLKERLSKNAYAMLCFWFANYMRVRILGCLGIHPSYPKGLPIIVD